MAEVMYLAFSDFREPDNGLANLPGFCLESEMETVFPPELDALFTGTVRYRTLETDGARLSSFIQSNLVRPESLVEIYRTTEGVPDFKVRRRRYFSIPTPPSGHTDDNNKPAVPPEADGEPAALIRVLAEVLPGDLLIAGAFLSEAACPVLRAYERGGSDTLVLAYGRMRGRLVLHFCRRQPEWACTQHEPIRSHTRRDMAKGGAKNNLEASDAALPASANLNGIPFLLQEHRYHYTGGENLPAYGAMRLAWLKQEGWLPVEWSNGPLQFIDAMAEEGSPYPEETTLTSLRFSFRESHAQAVIEKRFMASFGIQDDPLSYSWPGEPKEHVLHIEGLRLHDVYEQIEDPSIAAHFEQILPRDRRLLLLAYETESEQDSLEFALTAELDRRLDDRRTNGASLTSWMASPDGTGPHGHRLRFAVLGVVPSNFAETSEAELFLLHRRLPPGSDVTIL